MDDIRQYLLSVTSAALLWAILSALVDKDAPGTGVLRLAGGVFLTLTVLRPLTGVSMEEWNLIPPEIGRGAEQAVQEGADYAHQAKIQLIKDRSEAYILDKAADYGLELQVEVYVDAETALPARVDIWGNTSPYVRQQLCHLIQSELGIGKEDQHWMGSNKG